jgi:hypothetical protein
MALVLTGNEIPRFQQLTTLYALKLECLGMKHSRGSVYAKVKRDYSLKGSKQSVYEQLKSLLG